MKTLRALLQRARITALVFIVPLLAAVSLRAGEIHDAAAAGDVSRVQALVAADPTLLDSRDSDGNTPLISACWGPPANIPQEAVASLLIDKGANINARNTSGASPVYFAHRSYDLTRRLIAKGADVNVRAYGGLTPLHQATLSGNLQVVRLLIAHGADLNIRSNEGTILHRVINNEARAQSEMAQLLLQGGARLQTFSFGNTELHLVAMKGLADLVPLLVKHGADVNAVNEYGRTPLYYAARHGHRQAADALIGAGADARGIVETNYGRARQLLEPLKEGEAHLWYLGCDGSPCDGYAVRTKNHLLIFNPSRVDESPAAGLANGALNPSELAGQKMIVLITKRPDPRGPSVPELARALPGAEFVLNYKPDGGSGGTGNLPPYRRAVPNESFSVGGVLVHTIPAMLQVFFEGEGLGYLVDADGVRVFHPGLHVSGNEESQVVKYRKQIDFLKAFGPIDIAILPIKGRHIEPAYEPYLYLLDQLVPKAIYLIGDDRATDEHRKCVEVLRARNIPVAYPEGGIAVGERFHYIREPPPMTPLPRTNARALSGAYLGQPAPGGTPQVFARGIVSTDELEHSAPAFSPDGNEIFWSVARRDGDGWGAHVIMTAERKGEDWSAPAVAPFSGVFFDDGPVFSADGRRLYFSSADPAQPPPGSSRIHDIFSVERQQNGWSERRSLGLLARFPDLQSVGGPSITRDGTLYFSARSGLYRAPLVNGDYTKVEWLPGSINLPPFLNWTSFIAPDERYLLFSSNRPGGRGDGDLYISHRLADGRWTDAVNLGEPVNSDQQERFPSVSPDGRYLFFTRPTGHDQDVYWVDAATIPALRVTSAPAR